MEQETLNKYQATVLSLISGREEKRIVEAIDELDVETKVCDGIWIVVEVKGI